MRKLLILLLIISACKKEVSYYPSKSYFDVYKPQEIIIDDLSFEEVTDSITNGLFRKERYFLTLVDINKEYRVSPFTYTGGFIKEKNALEIIDDSICNSLDKVPLTQLAKRLKLHFENNGKVENLSDSYKRAFIKLVLEKNEDAIHLKGLLMEVIRTYNETNIKHKDSIDLEIMLDFPSDKIISTLPPPLPIIIED